MLSTEQHLKLSAQLALLGVIGIKILGISLTIHDEIIYMNAYHENTLDTEQLESLESATTELYTYMAANFQDVRLRTFSIAGTLLPREGIFVFSRLGIGWE